MKPSPIKETISFKDFEKLDIRVGTITSVSEVAKSNKLLITTERAISVDSDKLK
jgi:tRNA-binding protein